MDLLLNPVLIGVIVLIVLCLLKINVLLSLLLSCLSLIHIYQLLHPMFDQAELKKAVAIAKGLPASPGAASGQIYFTAAEAVEAAQNGIKALLVREETSPEDLAGMVAAQGILTARGGMTSHAAVVARGMGKCLSLIHI